MPQLKPTLINYFNVGFHATAKWRMKHPIKVAKSQYFLSVSTISWWQPGVSSMVAWVLLLSTCFLSSFPIGKKKKKKKKRTNLTSMSFPARAMVIIHKTAMDRARYMAVSILSQLRQRIIFKTTRHTFLFLIVQVIPF